MLRGLIRRCLAGELKSMKQGRRNPAYHVEWPPTQKKKREMTCQSEPQLVLPRVFFFAAMNALEPRIERFSTVLNRRAQPVLTVPYMVSGSK